MAPYPRHFGLIDFASGRLCNRGTMAALSDMGSPDGSVTAQQIAYYRARAQVKIGRNSVERTCVVDPMSSPEGGRLPIARRNMDAVAAPVITVGPFGRPPAAEEAIANGEVEAIALGRSAVADPECADKAERGKDIRRCTSCNCCVGCQGGGRVCAENPRTGLAQARATGSRLSRGLDGRGQVHTEIGEAVLDAYLAVQAQAGRERGRFAC